jgi:hypothetical protein
MLYQEEAASGVQIEKWEFAQVSLTRSDARPNPTGTLQPAKLQRISINSNAHVSGAPLILEFQKVPFRVVNSRLIWYAEGIEFYAV